MKEKELREHQECNLCNQKIGHTGVPLFYTATIKTYGLKMDALQRQQGLAMMLGGHGELAMVMGANEDVAEQVGDSIKLTICATCYDSKEHSIDILTAMAE